MERITLENNTPKRVMKLAPLAMAVALVSACSDPSDPDAGTSLSQTQVSGVAIDGYIAGATVYADLNDDGQRNPGEPSAVTDGEGYFSTSKSGVNYCANPSTEAFCLRISGDITDNLTLRIFGGTDLYTVQPFVGELSTTVAPPGEDGVIPDQFITPLTSLLTGQGDTEVSSLLGNLGLEADQVSADFLGATTVDQQVASIAYKLHKVASLFADLFEETYDFFGEESAFPIGASKLIYSALASHLAGSGDLDSSDLETIFDQVDDQIIALYNDNLDEDESPTGSQISNSDRSAVISNAAAILDIIDTAVPEDESGLDSDEIRARLMGVDMVTHKMMDDDTDGLDLSGVLDEALDGTELGPLFDFLDNADEIDFRSLLNIDYSAPVIDYSSVNISGGITFEDLGGQKLTFDYSDAKDNGYSVSGAALVLFQATEVEGEDSIDNSGELKLCLRYWDNEPEPELDDEGQVVYSASNTEGLLFDEAMWKTIGNRSVELDILNGLVVKITSKGSVETEDGTKNLLDFFYIDEGETWETEHGLTNQDTSLTIDSNDECRQALDSEFGELQNFSN